MDPMRKLVVAALWGCATVASAAGYSGLYVFGDSLSDSGNVAVRIGADPNQVISGNSYIPDRPYASGQFTNGNVWVNTFSSTIGLAPFGRPSLLGGGDFAFGGARVNTDAAGSPPSLTAQTNLFLNAIGGHAPSGALYVVEGGGNDARDALANAKTAPNPLTVVAAAAFAYARDTGAIVDQLQRSGAQHIVVWDVPNLGLAPAVSAVGPAASFLATELAQAMNSALAARLSIENDVKVFDIFGLQNQWAADPSAFGLSNVTDACGAVLSCDPSKYLFWDGIHPTSAGHALLAQQMAVAVVPEPATYALWTGGLMVFGWRFRRRA